jgi:hypothetical protein
MTVGRGEPDEGQSWRVTEVLHTPSGDELLQIIFEEIERELFAHEQPTVAFGVWQPVLRPFFRKWVNNLEFAEPEVRDGVFHFKVSLGKPWRGIAKRGRCVGPGWHYPGMKRTLFGQRPKLGHTLSLGGLLTTRATAGNSVVRRSRFDAKSSVLGPSEVAKAAVRWALAGQGAGASTGASR